MIDAGNIKELENFHTDLQEIFGIIQCRQDKAQGLNYVKSKEQYLQSERILKHELKKEERNHKRVEVVFVCKVCEKHRK